MLLMKGMMGSGKFSCSTSDDIIDDGNDGFWNSSM
jgi:hypothetical protein